MNRTMTTVAREGVEKTPRRLSKAAAVASYYGFVPQDSLRVTKEDRERARALLREYGSGVHHPFAEEKIALLRRYEEEKWERLHQPVMLYREERSPNKVTVHLDLLGSGHSIVEALLIKTATEALRETGAGNFVLSINSLGDRESFGRFAREITLFYRKKVDALYPLCRSTLKHNPLAFLACTHDTCQTIRQEAPKPIGFLSDSARIHFKEVLEYLETLSLPYDLCEYLLGPAGISSHTVFEIHNEKKELIAAGFRYNHLARRLGFRREIPALCAALFFSRLLPRAVRGAGGVPRAYFIQLGSAAKQRALLFLEELRRAGIPIAQSIASDKFSSQMAHAETLDIPYFIIVGHKEAMEGTALVRDRERHFQETIPMGKLSAFLKHLLAA